MGIGQTADEGRDTDAVVAQMLKQKCREQCNPGYGSGDGQRGPQIERAIPGCAADPA